MDDSTDDTHLGSVIAERLIEKNPDIFSARNIKYNRDIEGLRKDPKEILERVLYG